MKKFFALFCIPIAVIQEWEKDGDGKMADGEDQMMKEWEKWMQLHKESFVEEGQPLGSTKRVTTGGITDVRNDLTWYGVIQAESHEAAAKLFTDNPHLQIPQAYIEVMEITDMSEM
jgi:hypothetical protein